MVQFPGEFPDLLPFSLYYSFSLWWVSPKDTVYRKGASGNYHVSAIRLFKHLTVIYSRHPWSHPWKTSHGAGKIEKCWQKMRVEFAACTPRQSPGDLRPRSFLTSVSRVGHVPFCTQLRIRVASGGELGKPSSPSSCGLERSRGGCGAGPPGEGRSSEFWGGRGMPAGARPRSPLSRGPLGVVTRCGPDQWLVTLESHGRDPPLNPRWELQIYVIFGGPLACWREGHSSRLVDEVEKKACRRPGSAWGEPAGRAALICAARYRSEGATAQPWGPPTPSGAAVTPFSLM